jgi:hypothetical protein
MALLPERAPRHTVTSGLAGIVVLTRTSAYKVQCVRKMDGKWWSRGWSTHDLVDMVDATSEVASMAWAAEAGISPAVRAVRVVQASELPRWLPSTVFAKGCEAVMVTEAERVGPMRPETMSLASVKRIVHACKERRIVLDDITPSNFGQRNTKLLVLDWGRVARVQNPDLARRLTADGLLTVARGKAQPAVTAWLEAAARV